MSYSPMSSSRDQNERSDVHSVSESGTNKMALMSLTLAPSPVVRWILPARIRSRRQHDIIFIGSTYIQLREFHQTGQLSDMTAKLDFGTQIRGAAVISAKIERIPTVDAILDQEWDEERFIVKGKSCEDDQPPQILVLMTDAGELVYVYAKDSDNGKRVDLVFAKRALLQTVPVLERNLRHMVVDPECKAMACASYNTCTVFSLRDVADLRDSIDAWDPQRPESFAPHPEQRMISIEGHILRMNFLRATEEEPEKVILLLIIVNAGCTSLWRYRWDTREPLVQIQPMSGIPPTLQGEDKFPLLLIPSQKSASFVIVTELCLVYYDDITSPKPTRHPVTIAPETGPCKDHTWAQWAKPSRHDGYSNVNEDILLIRGDGQLRMFIRPHNPSTINATNYVPGKLNLGVDQAVCMLPGPRHLGGDILIVGGAMVDGGVFHLTPRAPLFMTQVIPNVSPVHSMNMVGSIFLKTKESRARRTFVTAGTQESSSINELRFGLEAQILWTVPFSGRGSVNRIWSFEHTRLQMLFILASHLEQTSAIALNLTTFQFEEMDSTQFLGLQVETCTLAAEMMSCGVSLQITPNCIVAGFETEHGKVETVSDCVCADIDGDAGLFIIACKSDTGHTIEVGMVVFEDDAQVAIKLSMAPYAAVERPLSMSLFRIAGQQYVSVGYSNGHLELFTIDDNGALWSESNVSSTDIDPSPMSSMLVMSHMNSSSAIILAGTRDGHLKVFSVVHVECETRKKSVCRLDRSYRIGLTSVSVSDGKRIQNGQSLSALVVCESRLDELLYFCNNACPDYTLSNIWLTARNDLAHNHPIITATTRTPNFATDDSNNTSNFVICATKDSMLFANVIEQEQMIPRRVKTDERGIRRMVFSDVLNKFIVVNDSIAAHNPIQTSGIIPAKSCALHLVDADRSDDDDVDEDDVNVVLSEQDKVKALMIWEPTDGKLHYNFIVLGLYDQNHSRLCHLSTRKLQAKSKAAQPRHIESFPRQELHALCLLGKSSIAVSVGKQIILIHLDFASKQFVTEAKKYDLPSPGLSISAQGSAIYIATQQHSVIVVKWRGSEKGFETVFTDRLARNTRAVIPFGKNGDHLLATTAVGQGTSVLMYSMRRNLRAHDSNTLLSEAEIPLHIDHIATIPTSWHSPTHTQSAFQGIAIDGTQFIFQTLSHDEYLLLRFIEQLHTPDPSKPVKKQIPIMTKRMVRRDMISSREHKAPLFNPKRMHVHGDVVKRVVDGGPLYLRGLLRDKIKNEDDMTIDGARSRATVKLEALAKPLVGDIATNDIPDAVIAWCRKMLRATNF